MSPALSAPLRSLQQATIDALVKVLEDSRYYFQHLSVMTVDDAQRLFDATNEALDFASQPSRREK